MLGSAESLERKRPGAARVALALDYHEILGQSGAPPRLGQGKSGAQHEVRPVLLQVSPDRRWVEWQQRQPRPGRLPRDGVEQRGREHPVDIVGADHAEGLVGRRRVELRALAYQQVQLGQQCPQGPLDLQSPRGRNQPPPRGAQQRIVEQAPQAGELRRHGWLTDAQLLRGRGHALVRQQGVQRDEEADFALLQIHIFYVSNRSHRFALCLESRYLPSITQLWRRP